VQPVTTAAPLRVTPQRQAVLDVLAGSADHPTAAEVYERVRARLPGIGAATVYRTLALLVASGAALALTLGGDSHAARYDANTERHDHLVCDECGRALDVHAGLRLRAVEELAAENGFSLTSFDLRLHGLCPNCQPRKD
jgi:Fe2+ or Zn2+ uptake regulation protein